MAILKCPICRQRTETSNPDYPFCSERCRLLDLGKWLNGVYRIPVLTPDFSGSEFRNAAEYESGDEDGDFGIE